MSDEIDPLQNTNEENGAGIGDGDELDADDITDDITEDDDGDEDDDDDNEVM